VNLQISQCLTLEQLIENTPDLPTLPVAVMAVVHETDSPEGSAQSVARYLQQDPALAARILRLSNSAYYSFSRQITEIPEAVVVLGMRVVRNLALIAGSYPWMVRELKGYELGPKELWSHSIAVATGSQTVARRARMNEAEAFSAGLFHNIGKVAMSIWLEKKVDALMDASEPSRSFDDIERELLGHDHAAVGAFLAESWNLPKTLVRPIRFHHNPEEAEDKLTDCVHVADYLAMSAGYNRGWDGLRYKVDPGAFLRLGLDKSDLGSLMEEFLQSAETRGKSLEEKLAA